MQVENRYELITVRYKNLDEYLRQTVTYTSDSWLTISMKVDSDLSVLVEYKRLLSGKSFDTVLDFLRTSTAKTVVIKTSTGVLQYKGSVDGLLKGKLISDKRLLRLRVRNNSMADKVLHLEV